MAFLGGLFGGSKSNTTTTQTQGTTVSSDVAVNVGAEFSPEFSYNADNSFAPTFNPTNVNAIDLTGFSEAVGAVAGVLQTVAGNVAASEARNQKQAETTTETSNNLLDGIQKFGGTATALLAIMAVIFALRDPGNVRVQL